MKKILSILVYFVLMFVLVSCTASKSDVTETSTAAASETNAATNTETNAASLTEAEIMEAYDKATKIYFNFEVCSLAVDSAVSIKEGNNIFYKVEDYSSFNELRIYMGTVLSEDLINGLIKDNADIYREFDGILYSIDGARGTDITLGEERVEIFQNNDTSFSVVVTVEQLDESNDLGTVIGYETHNDIYEKVNGKWVFTVFDYFR